jgi:hypothetical protein
MFLELRDSHLKKQGAANGRPRFDKSPKKNTRVNNTYLPAGGGM